MIIENFSEIDIGIISTSICLFTKLYIGCKISIVGVGMKSNVGVAQKMFETLAKKNINIQVISTSEIKISVLIDLPKKKIALNALHAAYGLGK